MFLREGNTILRLTQETTLRIQSLGFVFGVVCSLVFFMWVMPEEELTVPRHQNEAAANTDEVCVWGGGDQLDIGLYRSGASKLAVKGEIGNIFHFVVTQSLLQLVNSAIV